MSWNTLLKMRSKSHETVTEFRVSNNRQINWHESRIEEVATEVLSARLVVETCLCVRIVNAYLARVATILRSLTSKERCDCITNDKNKISIVRDRIARMTFVSFSRLFLYYVFFVAYAKYDNILVYFSRGRNHFTVSQVS